MVFPEYLHFSDSPGSIVEDFCEEFEVDMVAILVDENTKEYCLQQLSLSSAPIIETQSGELNKNLSTCELIWSKMTELGMSRNSLLVNLGGGVIGDMGGFAAATFKRGIRFINVPTTLLAMVDASIGGKLGIDFNGFKNHIGSFKNPDAVIISPIFLNTLPEKQLKSGYAEILKHALIYDLNYWDRIQNTDLQNADWTETISRSIGIKSEVVSNDPLEKGERKILNFGHTLGHAIETHFLDSEAPLLHGEAIAIGMLLEAYLSLQKGWLTTSQMEEITEVISKYYDLPSLPNLDTLQPLMSQDKKNTLNVLNFSLIEGIGQCKYDVQVESTELINALNYYKKV